MAKGDIKRILLNGVDIGAYVSTGDDLEDAAVGQKFLADKGLLKNISKQQQMYNQAFAFCSASSELWAKHLTRSPFNGHAVAPFVVNATLSIELYLKTLHAIEKHAPRMIHKLVTLYDDLPRRLRDAVDAEATRHTAEYKLPSTTNFREVLNRLNNAFEQWRYLYERRKLDLINVPETIFALRVLHELCSAELHPDVRTAH